MKSYTFLYVPCNPLACFVNGYTFLYGPSTFLYVSSYKKTDCYQKLYVPIRSVQTLTILTNLYQMLYVPIRSVQTPRNSYKFLYDVIRSYTFRANPPVLLANRYTFLYVPYTFPTRSGLSLSSVIRSHTFRARSPSPKSARWYTLAHLPESPHTPSKWP